MTYARFRDSSSLAPPAKRLARRPFRGLRLASVAAGGAGLQTPHRTLVPSKSDLSMSEEIDVDDTASARARSEGDRAAIAHADHAETGLLLGGLESEKLAHLQWDDEALGRPATPLWAWGVLVAAVFAVSSAGVVFALMREVPPVTLAAWRLQITSVLLGVGAAVQLRRMAPEERHRALRSAALLAASGTALALHFGAWVASLETTSLTHSLLFVSATPILLAAGAWILRRPISNGEQHRGSTPCMSHLAALPALPIMCAVILLCVQASWPAPGSAWWAPSSWRLAPRPPARRT